MEARGSQRTGAHLDVERGEELAPVHPAERQQRLLWIRPADVEDGLGRSARTVPRILRTGEGTWHATAVCRASKLGRTAISFDDGGNWRCRRVSDLSRYRQAQIGAAEVRQRRMSRHGRSGGNCSSCTPTPRQFSFRAAAVTRQNVLVNSRPSGGSRCLPTPEQVQHGQRRVAAASSQLLRRSSARPNQAIDPDRSRVQHSD